MRTLGFGLLLVAGTAFADPSADSKAATSIEQREPVGVGDKLTKERKTFTEYMTTSASTLPG